MGTMSGVYDEYRLFDYLERLMNLCSALTLFIEIRPE
jgi:hypothetical protein